MRTWFTKKFRKANNDNRIHNTTTKIKCTPNNKQNKAFGSPMICQIQSSKQSKQITKVKVKHNPKSGRVSRLISVYLGRIYLKLISAYIIKWLTDIAYGWFEVFFSQTAYGNNLYRVYTRPVIGFHSSQILFLR